MKIDKADTQSVFQGPKEWFTGDVEVRLLFTAESPARTGAARVSFQPGARTAWHTHPLGQSLIITSGKGWVQKEGALVEEVQAGDVVWFEPGEKHWHGASPDQAMSHFAIQEEADGSSVSWMEHVTDREYER